MSQTQRNYGQTKSHYETLREIAREVAHEGFKPVLRNSRGSVILKDTITLNGLTLDTQKELRKWEKQGTRRVAWNWDQVRSKYRAHPKRFELSIWHQGFILCSASIGKPTRGGGKLRLDYLESAPMGTPIDGLITDITIAAGIAYARTIGAAQIRIMNPVNEKVKNHYLSKPGFNFDEKGDFCYRDLI